MRRAIAFAVVFVVAFSLQAGAESLYVTTTGVGVGTQSPSKPLDVNGQCRFQGTATFGAGINLTTTGLISQTTGQGMALQTREQDIYMVDDGAGPSTENDFAVFIASNGNFGISGLNFYNWSDERIKEDVAPLTDAIDKVMGLRGVSYYRKGRREEGRKIGVVAQEVEGVLPEIVAELPNP